MARPSWLILARSVLGVALVLLLAGCGASTSVVGNATAVPSTTATTAPTPTATATPVPTTCAQLPGFGAATALNLAHMQFPASTVAPQPIGSVGDTGQFTVSDYSACTPNSTTALTVSTGKGPEAFTHLLLFYGWGPSKTFPADAQFQSACGSVSCFVSQYMGAGDDPITQQYLELKSVSASSTGLVTYHVVLAYPPSKPACSVPIYDSNTHPYFTAFGTIPVPPLTREGTPDGHMGSVTHYLCSAGTAATVSAFMNKALPMAGWSKGSGSYPGGGCDWNQMSGGHNWCLNVSITSAADWIITTHAPM